MRRERLWGAVFLLILITALALWIFRPRPYSAAVDSDELEIPEMNPQEKLLRRAGYSLVFDHRHKNAKWVAYSLTAEKAEEKLVSRADRFQYDSEVDSATPAEFSRSGYDRGHMVPAEDMRWSPKAMLDSFLMSNVSPQKPCLNRGPWKRLEARVRDWAKRLKKIFIVTGPLEDSEVSRQARLPASEVAIPKAFFKVILENSDQLRAIGFLFRNECSEITLAGAATTVRNVEKISGINFFPKLPEAVANDVENSVDRTFWLEND